MPAKVLDVAKARVNGDLRDVVHHAVQALAEGHLVVFPTETVYGLAASGLSDAALERLVEAKGRAPGHALPLAIRSVEDALDYIPDMPPIAQRLARRCWPGPLTLVLKASHPDSLLRQLPEAVRKAVCPAGTLGLRVPAAPLVLEVLRLLAGPLLLTSANRTGEPEAMTGQEAASLPGDIRYILDDGRCQFGQPSTVVEVEGNQLKILRQGVISAAHLQRLASTMVLFVCTGNTCRSPMAEALCRRLVAEKLNCKPEELDDRGVIIASAGIAAMSGGRAAAEAVDVMCDRGAALDAHASQPLREQLVRQADMIFAMTRTHREAILSEWPHAASRTHLLASGGEDIPDPIGGPKELYERCADQLESFIRTRLNDIVFDEIVVKGND